MGRRRILICSVLVLLGTLVNGPGPAAGSGELLSVASHNIEHDGWGGLRYVAEHDRPLMLMGQEVCADALWELQVAIGQYGYGQKNINQVPSSSVCDGEALFTVAWTLFPQPPPYQWSGMHPGSTTHGWACIRGSFGFLVWKSCSTHMNGNNHPLAYLQAENLRLNIVPPSSMPTIVGGDFNLRPRGHGGHNMVPWRGSWDEGDDACFLAGDDRRTLQPGPAFSTCIPASLPNVKIDYTQASGLHFYGASGVADIRCGVSSDHCLYFATYRWR